MKWARRVWIKWENQWIEQTQDNFVWILRLVCVARLACRFRAKLQIAWCNLYNMQRATCDLQLFVQHAKSIKISRATNANHNERQLQLLGSLLLLLLHVKFCTVIYATSGAKWQKSKLKFIRRTRCGFEGHSTGLLMAFVNCLGACNADSNNTYVHAHLQMWGC